MLSGILLGLLAFAPAVPAAVSLDIPGGRTLVTSTSLEVEVDVKNVSTEGASGLSVTGRLLGRRGVARLEGVLGAGETTTLTLHFPPLAPPRPGLYPLALLLEYAGAPPAPAAGFSQCGFLLLPLPPGSRADPAVRLDPGPARLATVGELAVGIESADGQPHRVRLRVATPRSFRALDPPSDVGVPGQGRVDVVVRLVKVSGGIPLPTEGVVLTAEAEDGALERTTAVTALVTVESETPVLPRLYAALGGIAALLIVATVVAEFAGRAPFVRPTA